MKHALVWMNLQLFWKMFWHRKLIFESPRHKTLVREIKATGGPGLEQFTMVELQDARKHFRGNKCADSNRLVAECFVYGSLELHEHSFIIFN